MIYLFVIIPLSFFCNIVLFEFAFLPHTYIDEWLMFTSKHKILFPTIVLLFEMTFKHFCLFGFSFSNCVFLLLLLLLLCRQFLVYCPLLTFHSNALNALGLCIRPTNKRCDINWQNTSFNDKSLELLIKMCRRLIVCTQKLFSMLLC